MITDDRRRKLRLIIMLAIAPVALFGLLFAAKAISVNAAADATQTAFQRRAWQEASTHANVPLVPEWANVLEPWKGFYNRGVSRGMGGQLVEARADLQTALEMQAQPGTNDYCIILTSLVYVVEKQGDEAREGGDTQAANGFYNEALVLIEEAPEGCFEPPAPGEANTQEQLEASTPRIEEKIEEEGGGGGEDGEDGESGEEGDPNEGDPGEGEPTTQEEQLAEQNQQAQEQQQAQEDYYEQQEGGEPGGGGVDQPW